jgi:hypothetical protein
MSNGELNRIIFASPLKNRVTFQRTFFRSSIYYTIEDKRGKGASKSSKERGDKAAKQGAEAIACTPMNTKQ